MSQSDSSEAMTFVVLQLCTGTRIWLPLPASAFEVEALVELGGATELGRTSCPQELERLMSGKEKGRSDEDV